MTVEVLIVLAILLSAFILSVSNWLRMDLVALLVVATLSITGLLTPGEALAGFSNPATVTVWAMFILSGSLQRTGVAGAIGRQILRLAPTTEVGLVAAIMVTASLISAFMNNVGVIALLLPATMDICRQTSIPPSRLLMPLAVGTFLGGMTTLIGTAPNLLVSDALRKRGLEPLELFDFTPIGLVLVFSGLLFVTLVGRRFLPHRDPAKESAAGRYFDLGRTYELNERMFIMRLTANSVLAGRTLAESRLGSILGLNVIAVLRNALPTLAPPSSFVLRSGDRLIVSGRLDALEELRDWRHFDLESDRMNLESLVSSEIELAEIRLAPKSPLIGRTLLEVDFRRRFSVNVLAIRRDVLLWRTNLQLTLLKPGDVLLVQGRREHLDQLGSSHDFDSYRSISRREVAEEYQLHDRLFLVSVPSDSHLAGRTLSESRLGEAFGLMVLGIVREDLTQLMPEPDEPLQAGDRLLIAGRPSDLLILQGLQELEITSETVPELGTLESERIGLQEVILSPHSNLPGETLRRIHFREKFGLSVLAILREGNVHRANLRDMPLQFGDALLLYGPREKLRVLGTEPDFIVLSKAVQEPPRIERAPVAALLMLLVLLPVVAGWIHISIAAIAGAALMVLTRCISMEEAYRSIDWRAVFLIAGMLPLGTAMEQTGTASLLGDLVVSLAGGHAPRALIGILYVLSFLLTQVIPPPATAVLMAPIGLSAAAALQLSPHTMMLTIAIAVSAGFLSPVTQPGNVMIMGPAGYRPIDYLRMGLPLAVIGMVIALLVLPLIWPL